MADAEEVAYLTAVELTDRYRSGLLAPIDVVRVSLERADRYRDLNILTALDVERSLAEARRAASRYREGRARPLEGVPVVVKDLIDTAGLATGYGSSIFAGHVPERDAAVVRRVREAGGIVLGKSATHEFAWGITTDGGSRGPTRNPWDPAVVPGGSSGGSAAALAAGLAPLALGTDTAGSVRIPAAFCGVAALKPTFGSVPADGVFPLAPSLDTVGPMARGVGDLELLSSVISPCTRDQPTSKQGIVFGVWEQVHQAECTPEIDRVFRAAVSALRRADASVVSVTSDELPALYPTLGATVGAEGIAGHRSAGLWPERRSEYHHTVRQRLEHASGISLKQYAQAQRDRALITSLAARVLSGVDVLLSPVSGVSPAPIGHDAEIGSALARSFRERVMTFTALQSLTGLPACTVRAGFDDQGLPVGVQLTSAWGREGTLLRAARFLVDAVPEVQQQWPTS